MNTALLIRPAVVLLNNVFFLTHVPFFLDFLFLLTVRYLYINLGRMKLEWELFLNLVFVYIPSLPLSQYVLITCVCAP